MASPYLLLVLLKASLSGPARGLHGELSLQQRAEDQGQGWVIAVQSVRGGGQGGVEISGFVPREW